MSFLCSIRSVRRRADRPCFPLHDCAALPSATALWPFRPVFPATLSPHRHHPRYRNALYTSCPRPPCGPERPQVHRKYTCHAAEKYHTGPLLLHPPRLPENHPQKLRSPWQFESARANRPSRYTPPRRRSLRLPRFLPLTHVPSV